MSFSNNQLREHILKRPENYIGSPNKEISNLWVVENDKFILKKITFVPGLYKIFDEILVNAANNCQLDPATKNIQVEINAEEGFISIWNDGKAIPIEQKKDEADNTSYWIPELTFGHLSTSFNWIPDLAIGVKLANVYSKLFIVEIISYNSHDDKYYEYVQRFTDNMSNIEKPQIKEVNKEQVAVSTKIKFYPDLRFFGMIKLDEDIISLFTKRVYDMAGILSDCSFFLNGNKIAINSFSEYCKQYLQDKEGFLCVNVNDKWQIGISSSPDRVFNQVSFVNSFCTIQGGTHVDYITDQIAKYIIDKCKLSIDTKLVKQFLFIFVNCLIENPCFDSQTRDTLTKPQNQFGNTCEIPEVFLKKIMKTSIPYEIKEYINYAKVMKEEETKIPRLVKYPCRDIEDLVDANEAVKKDSLSCTLIVTIGDCLKTIAINGLSIIGNDYYGVFAFRNTLIFKNDVSSSRLYNSIEIQNFIKILGLKRSMKYDTETSLNELRYGSIILMANQDQDGSNFKGSIIYFIYSLWPDLIRKPGFISEFITPLVKVNMKENLSNKIYFYTIPEFNEWKKNHNENDYIFKFYYGFATANDEEIKDYFLDFKRHKVDFQFTGQNDADKIMLAFDKKLADQRRIRFDEIDSYSAKYLGVDASTISYADFIDKEIILYKNNHNIQEIPSVVDGLKPGQRKVLWTLFKRNMRKREIKVKQLAEKVSQLSACNKSTTSIAEIIVSMAQTFVGSNNINLLYPSGQFGSRLNGGKDFGTPNYIYTRLNEITRKIFHKDDDELLEYFTDEDIQIEPKYYVPIIPMVLVNGNEGIGFGWISSVPCFNPLDVIKNIRHKIKGEDLEEMTPWYSGFTGEIKLDNTTIRWFISGIAREASEQLIEITELPIGTSTSKFEKFLQSLLQEQASPMNKFSKGPLISDFKQYCNGNFVHFDVYCNKNQMDVIKSKGIYEFFNLTKMISTQKMTLFSPDGHIKKYESVNQIIDDFFQIRLKLYEERKDLILKNLNQKSLKISNQIRLLNEFNEGQIELKNASKEKILLLLKERNYDLITKKKPKTDLREEEDNDEEEVFNPEIKKLSDGYDYLVSLFSQGFSQSDLLRLTKKKEEIEKSIQNVMQKQPVEMWMDDLDILEKEYNEFELLRQRKRESEKDDAKSAKEKSKFEPKINQFLSFESAFGSNQSGFEGFNKGATMNAGKGFGGFQGGTSFGQNNDGQSLPTKSAFGSNQSGFGGLNKGAAMNANKRIGGFQGGTSFGQNNDGQSLPTKSAFGSNQSGFGGLNKGAAMSANKRIGGFQDGASSGQNKQFDDNEQLDLHKAAFPNKPDIISPQAGDSSPSFSASVAISKENEAVQQRPIPESSEIPDHLLPIIKREATKLAEKMTAQKFEAVKEEQGNEVENEFTGLQAPFAYQPMNQNQFLNQQWNQMMQMNMMSNYQYNLLLMKQQQIMQQIQYVDPQWQGQLPSENSSSKKKRRRKSHK